MVIINTITSNNNNNNNNNKIRYETRKLRRYEIGQYREELDYLGFKDYYILNGIKIYMALDVTNKNGEIFYAQKVLGTCKFIYLERNNISNGNDNDGNNDDDSDDNINSGNGINYNKNIIYISEFEIKKEVRNKGYGNTLFKHIINKYGRSSNNSNNYANNIDNNISGSKNRKNKNGIGLYLCCYKNNTNALKIYSKYCSKNKFVEIDDEYYLIKVN